ncbi:MAG: hypothetical protein RL094_109 [Candidatus Parcubacteria bacterium]|jgi:undecaprenyl-diphosphatase
MTLLHALILGIVEGITEFLPISSTGHLILVSKLLGIEETSFTTSFNVIIQLGAILAVLVLYWRVVFSNKELFKKAVIGFVPTMVLGLVFYKVVKTFLGSPSVVAWSLIIGGILLIVFEKRQKPGQVVSDNLTYKQSALVGVFQSIAFIPGVSRSAATIVGGQLMGISRKAIVEFSFILAVPTMLAASTLDILKHADTFTTQNIELLVVGFITAFVVAFLAIKSFLSYIQKHSFVAFGVYRIIVGIIFLLFVLR